MCVSVRYRVYVRACVAHTHVRGLLTHTRNCMHARARAHTHMHTYSNTLIPLLFNQTTAN